VIEREKQDIADFLKAFHSRNQPPEETPTLLEIGNHSDTKRENEKEERQ
jgi:hypothetical protein